jgi:beta-glucanase (GH16 family)
LIFVRDFIYDLIPAKIHYQELEIIRKSALNMYICILKTRNMKRNFLLIKATVATACLYLACKGPEAAPPKIGNIGGGGVPVAVTYSFETTPTWQDEFDNTGEPDAKKWGYDLGGGGWGNNEKQIYTKDLKNARVENGKLIIQALFEGGRYSSARLVTKKKEDFTYGKIVVKAKIPQGTGTWPAIWMLASDQNYGKNFWPDNGEIDIMEHVGFDPNVIHANIHTLAYNHSIGTNKGNNTKLATAISDFHEYICEWTPNEVKMSIDDQMLFSFKKETGADFDKWPFDKPFHLLLNVAVGGNWGGQKGIDDTVFPQKMEVDYVRVYALKK